MLWQGEGPTARKTAIYVKMEVALLASRERPFDGRVIEVADTVVGVGSARRVAGVLFVAGLIL